MSILLPLRVFSFLNLVFACYLLFLKFVLNGNVNSQILIFITTIALLSYIFYRVKYYNINQRRTLENILKLVKSSTFPVELGDLVMKLNSTEIELKKFIELLVKENKVKLFSEDGIEKVAEIIN